MVNLAVLKQDFLINRKGIALAYVLQTISLALAAGIRYMRLIAISDVFWDTIPVILIPMLVCIGLTYSLVKKRVDDKTMDFLLATDLSPKELIRTKAMFLLFHLFLLMVFSMALGLVAKVYDLTGVWTRDTFIVLYIGGFCLQIFMAGYCFLISCAGLKKRESFYFGAAAAVLVLEYLLYLVYYLHPDLSALQYVTVFSLFRQSRFATGEMLCLATSLLLTAVGIALFVLAGRLFFSYSKNDK